MNIEPVAYFHSPLREKFGIPRQAGLAPGLRGEVRFVKPFDAPEAVRGLEGFDWCWLIWGFSQNQWEPGRLTVRPPRLGGNERVGVFASRSPFRPNGLGLSCVRIDKVGEGLIEVSGADLADGTPVYDVKPYVAYADSRPGARSGFVDSREWPLLNVIVPESLKNKLLPDQLEALVQILAQDPRPHYQDDSERVYGLVFGDMEIKFRISGDELFVLSAEKC